MTSKKTKRGGAQTPGHKAPQNRTMKQKRDKIREVKKRAGTLGTTQGSAVEMAKRKSKKKTRQLATRMAHPDYPKAADAGDVAMA